MLIPVVTVDGPGGVGKGTSSQTLAQALGWHYLDSGAIYRALAVAARCAGVAPANVATLTDLAIRLDLRFEPSGPEAGPARIFLGGRDISGEARQEDTGNLASAISVHPPVREALLMRQRAFRQAPGLVTEGRDMGTVVFPDATLKVFLTASAEIRAERRHKQLMRKGLDVKLSRILGEIRERDERDATRPVSPLKPAADAVILDSSQLSVADVAGRLLLLCRERSLIG